MVKIFEKLRAALDGIMAFTMLFFYAKRAFINFREALVMVAALFITFFVVNFVIDLGVIPSFGGLVDTFIQLLITAVLLLFVWKRAKRYA